MSRNISMAPILALWIAVGSSVAAAQSGPVVKMGGVCDRTGATKIIGEEFCPGVADYIALINKRGGVQEHRLEYTEFDHAYIVPRALDAYERLKRDGVVIVMNYGVPILYGLTPRYMADQIPSITPGTGRNDAIDGEVWRYIFPGTASYWSQTGAALAYFKDNGARQGTKIAFLYLDSPAGREGIPMLEAVAKKEGYSVRLYPVQPPGLQMEPLVNSIVNDFKADWVIASLFGQPPAVAIREFRNAGFSLSRVIGFVWGAGDADVREAGWDVAQGYLGLQFASVGRDHQIIKDLIKMFGEEGRDVPAYVGGVYYNRGVLVGALMVEGIRLAIKNHGAPITGDKVRRGLEAIRDFDLQGFSQPLLFTPQDHEGGGYVKVYQVKGNAWAPVTGWIRGYRDEVMALVRKTNNK